MIVGALIGLAAGMAVPIGVTIAEELQRGRSLRWQPFALIASCTIIGAVIDLHI